MSETHRLIPPGTTVSTLAPILAALLAVAPPASAATGEATDSLIDEVTVTATRTGRTTRDVTQNISAVSSAEIEELNLFNPSDALKDLPGVLAQNTSGGYSSRLVIRGAGLRAQFGVREITVLRDGVPLTDPDSFTRFDFIDLEDLEQIEVTRGPGSIYSAGTVGGVVQFRSRSVFEPGDDRLQAGFGSYDERFINARLSGNLGEKHYWTVNATHRYQENDWRPQNEYRKNQIAGKYGYRIDPTSFFEAEISYSDVNLELPASLTPAEFAMFEDRGRVDFPTQWQWQNSSRDSNILFFNARYEKDFENFTFRPRVYANAWNQDHPVTGRIVDTPDALSMGTDLESEWRHSLFGRDATFVSGVTIRSDTSDNDRRWTYADVATQPVFVPFPPPGSTINVIQRTLSDAKGELSEIRDSDTTLAGFYAQESFRPFDGTLVDVSFRYDNISFDINGDEQISYNFGTRAYEPGAGEYVVNEDYNPIGARLGVSQEVTETISLFANAAYGEQVPSEAEITGNIEVRGPDLESAESTSFEAGVKARGERYSLDVIGFYNPVKNEIVQSRIGDDSIFQNAGKTNKQGVELQGELEVLPGLILGGAYTYSDFTFDDFQEVVFGGGPPRTEDRSGNRLPYIPENYYSINARYSHPTGINLSVRTLTWGSYYLDSANSEKYPGFDFVTDATIGYERGPHRFQLNVSNVFDNAYAAEVKKNSAGAVTYVPAAPRTWLLKYMFLFDMM